MSGIDSTLKSEAREVRRLEVINGALGRRRWSPEAKARIVAESLAPGVAVSEVARRGDPGQLGALFEGLDWKRMPVWGCGGPTPRELWSGLTVFLDDGRVEICSNIVERSIRPIALSRKNALFAGSDQGGVHWGVIASLIETCKLNAVDPQAYLASTLTRLVNRHPPRQIDQLMPWAYAPTVA